MHITYFDLLHPSQFHIPPPFRKQVNKSSLCCSYTHRGGAIRWNMVSLPGTLPLKETDFPFPESHQLSAEGRGSEPLPTPCWNADRLDLVQVVTAAVSHEGSVLSCPESTFTLRPSLASGSYSLSAPSSATVHKPQVGLLWSRCPVCG